MGYPNISLAVDAGQSSTRVRAVGSDVPDLSLPGVNTAAPLPPQWATLLRSALARTGPASTVALGSSGLGLSTKLLPAARATGNIHIGTITGKLKGVMPATTPSG